MSAEKNTKWTPGPWVYDEDYWGCDGPCIRTDYDEDQNMDEGRAWDEDLVVFGDALPRAADARLASKAPEMAELLETITAVPGDMLAVASATSKARALLSYINGDGE